MEEEDQYYFIDSKTMMVEDMNIKSLKLYKCYKVNDKLDGQVLFIFKLHNLDYTGQLGPLTKPLIPYHTECTQQCMATSAGLYNLGRNNDDNEFLRSVNDITSRVDIFSYHETNSQFANDLTRLIRSCYRFSEGMLSALNEDSLVFVVELVRKYATNTMLLVNEQMIVESDDVGYEESSIGDEMDKDEWSNVDANVDINNANDCDYRSVVMSFSFDDDTEKEDEEMLDCETPEKKARNEIINEVRNWQGLDNNYEPILEEIKPLITYEDLDWNTIGNDYVITKEEEKRGECAICLTPYTGKVRHQPIFTWLPDANSFKVVRLGCGHSFHHCCIFEWLDKNQTCPLCRSVSYVTV